MKKMFLTAAACVVAGSVVMADAYADDMYVARARFTEVTTAAGPLKQQV